MIFLMAVFMFLLFMVFRNEQVFIFKTKFNDLIHEVNTFLIYNNKLKNVSDLRSNYDLSNSYHWYFFRFWVDLETELKEVENKLFIKYGFIKTMKNGVV